MKTIKERLEWILEQEEMFVPSQIGDEIQEIIDEIEAFLEKELNTSVPKRKSVYVQLRDNDEQPVGILKSSHYSETCESWTEWCESTEGADDVENFIEWHIDKGRCQIERIFLDETY